MGRTRRFFISDIHLSSSRLYEAGHAWFNNSTHKNRLLNFLTQNILDNPRVKDLVLLGDVFDKWVCPAEVTPPTYPEIFDSNREFLDLLNRIASSGIQVFYVNGNHDFDLNLSDLKAEVPAVQGIKYYKTARLHAEHGHRFDELFNGPDYFCDPGFGRPIGYVISRLAASIEAAEKRKGYGLFDLPSYIDDLIEAGTTSQNIFESIIEGLAEQAGLGKGDVIHMPGHTNISIRDAMNRYARLAEKFSPRDVISEIWSRFSLGRHADRLCRKSGINIVIFGHSHKSKIDRDFFLVEDRVYANSGTWCKNRAYCVEVDKKNTKAVTVKLHQVDESGKPCQTVARTV